MQSKEALDGERIKRIGLKGPAVTLLRGRRNYAAACEGRQTEVGPFQTHRTRCHHLWSSICLIHTMNREMIP